MNDVPRLLNQAISHQKAGQLEEAERLYEEVLELSPLNFDAIHLLGTLADQVGKWHDACHYYRQALEIQPDSPLALNNYGNALARVAQYEEAEASFRRAIELAPNFAEAHNNLGLCLASMGELDKALEAYEAALAIKPDFAQVYHNAANLLGAMGDLDSAEQAARKALDLHPNYRVAMFTLAEILRCRGELAEARDYYEKTILMDRAFGQAWNGLGLVLIRQGDLELGIRAFQEALADNPEYAEARINLHQAVAKRPKDSDLLAAILSGERQSVVTLDIDLDHISHPHAPVGGTAYSNWGLAGLTIIAGFLLWLVPLVYAVGIFAICLGVYWVFGRPVVARKHRNYILEQVRRDSHVWIRLWQFGGVRLSYVDGDKSVVLTAPDDDWRPAARFCQARADSKAA